MSDTRIVSPDIAHTLALREDWQRRRAEYWWGWMLGQAALGNERYVRMVETTVKVHASWAAMP